MHIYSEIRKERVWKKKHGIVVITISKFMCDISVIIHPFGMFSSFVFLMGCRFMLI